MQRKIKDDPEINEFGYLQEASWNGIERTKAIGGRGHFSEYSFINYSAFWNHINVLSIQGRQKGRR